MFILHIFNSSIQSRKCLFHFNMIIVRFSYTCWLDSFGGLNWFTQLRLLFVTLFITVSIGNCFCVIWCWVAFLYEYEALNIFQYFYHMEEAVYWYSWPFEIMTFLLDYSVGSNYTWCICLVTWGFIFYSWDTGHHL